MYCGSLTSTNVKKGFVTNTIVQNIVEKLFSPKVTNVKSSYDVTLSVRVFLQKLCLSTITYDPNQGIVKLNNKRRFVRMLLFVTSMSVCATLCRIYTNWSVGWILPTYLSCILFGAALSASIGLYVINYCLDIKHYKRYYSNYELIDKFLNINAAYYKAEKRQVNIIIFFTRFHSGIEFHCGPNALFEQTFFNNTRGLSRSHFQ